MSLRRLAEVATPGPWGDPEEVTIGEFGWHVPHCPAGETEDSPQGRADAAFIAAANPTAVLGLLDEVERLRATVERIEALADEVDADTAAGYERLREHRREAFDTITRGGRIIPMGVIGTAELRAALEQR